MIGYNIIVRRVEKLEEGIKGYFCVVVIEE